MDYLLQGVQFLLRRRWLAFLLILVFFISLGSSVIYRGGFEQPRRTDMTVFVGAARAIHENLDIYDYQTSRHWHYVYLPLLATLIAPLAKIPLLVHIIYWYLLSFACLIGTIALASRLMPDPSTNLRQASLAAFLCLPVFLDTMARGQLGMAILFLITLVLFLYFQRWDFLAGGVLGFAVILKTSPPFALIFYFLFKKEWRVLWGVAAGALLWGLIWPSLILGPERNWLLLKKWLTVMNLATSDQAHQSHLWKQLLNPFAEDNQSIRAALTRLSWSSQQAYIGHSHGLIDGLVKAFGAGSLLALAFVARGNRSASERKILLVEGSLFSMIMLFVSPVSEHHHYTVLFLPVLAALFCMGDFPTNSLTYQFLQFGIFTAAFSIFFGLVFPYLNYLGISVWGSLILWMILLVFLFRNSVRLPRWSGAG